MASIYKTILPKNIDIFYYLKNMAICQKDLILSPEGVKAYKGILEQFRWVENNEDMKLF